MELGKPIAKGYTAEVYLVDGQVVKVFDERFQESESKNEAKKQRVAALCGLPVPKVLDVTQIGARPAIVMEYWQGPTLGAIFEEVKDRDKQQAKEIFRESVEIQLQINAKKPVGLELMKEKLLRQINTAGALDDTLRGRLLERLETMPFTGQLCHGDFHIFNLIRSDTAIGIIDWVDASTGSPCADACRTYLLYSLSSIEWAEVYLNLYCSLSGYTREEILAWAPFIAGARLAENASSQDCDYLLHIVKTGLLQHN